ncbi:GroES-like protein [Peniophora sp. CONT]|nr:GroES-like protein [Peniophora sp. CONT]
MASLPDTIKVVQIQDNKTVAVVTIPFASQEKVQNLPEDQVLVRIRAAGLNPSDWKHALTAWGTPGAISGCDAAGDVVAVGSAVTHLKVGDRVAAFNDGGSWQNDNGAFAEYARFVAAACFVLPPEMTYEEGASFPGAHFTSVQILYMRLPIPKPLTPEVAAFKEKGEKILIWGASTAVGHHAVQLATLSGLEVFATASPAAHESVKALGASHVFDYKDPEVVSKIQAAAGEKGIIYAIDCVVEKGSAEATIDAISLTRGGKVMVVLPVPESTEKRRMDVSVQFNLVGTVFGREITVAHSWKQPPLPEDTARIQEWCARDVHRLLEGWKAGVGSPLYKPQRLREVPGGLEGIERGMRIMQEGAYGREKLVCKIA